LIRKTKNNLMTDLVLNFITLLKVNTFATDIGPKCFNYLLKSVTIECSSMSAISEISLFVVHFIRVLMCIVIFCVMTPFSFACGYQLFE
jgi:hypothetical protein